MGVQYRVVRRLFVLGLLAVIAGCSAKGNPPPPAGEKPHVEADLARITLSPRAVKSLKVEVTTTPVRREKVQEYRSYIGWVAVRPGDEVTLTAPLAGTVRGVGENKFPMQGQAVSQNDALLSLEPVLMPLDQIQLATLKRGVENEMAKARQSVTVAESELKRMQELHDQKLRGLQDLEQARARLEHAKADLSSAEDKLKLFNGTAGGRTTLPALTLTASRTGTVMTVQVTPGQYVAAATPLLTITDVSHPLVRVPIPEQDFARLDRKQPAQVRAPGSEKALKVPFEELLSQVDPVRRTIDVYCNCEGTPPQGWRKDQLLSVQVPLGERQDQAIVPYGSIVFDGYGGTWVYVDQTPKDAQEHIYERVRVEVGPSVEGGVVALRSGLKGGEKVVNAPAAAKLFSREFHRPPLPPGTGGEVDDDDD